jgi:hypothetical protein
MIKKKEGERGPRINIISVFELFSSCRTARCQRQEATVVETTTILVYLTGALILLLERVKPGPQVTARKAHVIRTKLRKRKKEIQCFSLHS